MLTQTKVKMTKRSQRGSVLLMVVLSIMLLFTLTTICLDVINRSTKASSRNVQKTQAKITAESVLTQFIDGYKVGRGEEGITSDKVYQGLMDMAGSQTSPTTIDVTLKDSSGNTVDAGKTIGDTKLYIYTVGTNLKVESVCTYSTQTQTASVIFKAVTKSPYVPSNTIESQNGTVTTGYSKQVSCTTDGSYYIEKNGDDPNSWKGFSRQDVYAHIYSEYSLAFDDGALVTDITNKVNKNMDPGDRFYKTSDDDKEFKQAPTLVTEGNITCMNCFHIFTSVGKTDANGYTPDHPLYDPTNLGNYDGYVLCGGKLIGANWKRFYIGGDAAGYEAYHSANPGKTYSEISENLNNSYMTSSTAKPIDVYCHGAFLGKIPTFKAHEGTSKAVDFGAQYAQIYSPPDVPEQYNADSKTHLNGNLYCYPGPDKDTGIVPPERDGNLVVSYQDSVANPAHYYIKGDVYVNGDVYISKNSFLHMTGNFYCTGNIYVFDPGSDNNVATYNEIAVCTCPTTLSSSVTSSLSDRIIATKYCKVIDYSIQRNNFPKEGYDPASGHQSDERTTLKTLYGQASANMIYKASIEGIAGGFTPELVNASRELFAKHADARLNVLKKGAGSKTGYWDKSTVDGHDTYKIYKSAMIAQDAALSDSPCIYFQVELRDEDVVLLLPTGYNKEKIRVNRCDPTNPSKNDWKGFLYLMFYDPAKPNLCLYYDGDEDITDRDGNLLNDPDNPSQRMQSLEADSYDWDRTTASTSDDPPTIKFGIGNDLNNGQVQVADNAALTDNPSIAISDSFKAGDFKANTDGVNNYIMYLIPKDFDFNFGGSPSGDSANQVRLQGLLYGPASDINLHYGTENRILGQVKGNRVSITGNQTDKLCVRDCPMAKNSLLDYVAASNNSTSAVEIQYFQY